MQRLGQSLGGEPPASRRGFLTHPGLLEARSRLYKSPCGGETMREKRPGPHRSLPSFVPTCAKSGQMPIKTSLAAHEISCQRGGRLLFAELELHALSPAKALLVTGPNGAGKTSLLRLIAGLLPLARRAASRAARRRVPLPELCHYVGPCERHQERAHACARMSPSGSTFSAAAVPISTMRLRCSVLTGLDDLPGRPAVGGTEAEACAPSPVRRAPPDLAARRAVGLARRRFGQGARQGHRAAILRKAASPWWRAIRR